MKKLIAVTTVFLILLSTSCNKKVLDITPDGKISLDEIFNDPILIEAYLNTIYGCIPSYHTSYFEWSFLAGITDEAQDAEVGSYNTLAGRWIGGALSPSSDPLAATGTSAQSNIYATMWSGIYYTNVFLQRLENVSVISSEVKNRFRAETQVLRAFFYLELAKKYGPLPIITEPLPLAFDYRTLLRPTFQEVIDFVVSECNMAIDNPNLPMRITNESDRQRFTKAVAYAITSQAALFNASPLWNPGNDREKWQAASTITKRALDALTHNNQFELNPDYGEYFFSTTDYANQPRDKETIYETRHRFPRNVLSIPSRGGNFKIGACPSQELVDSYGMIETGEPAVLGYEDSDHLKPIINTASGYDEKNPYVGRDPRFYATVWFNGAQWDNINGRIHTVETYVGGTDQVIKTPSRLHTRTGYYLRKFVDPRIPVTQDYSPSFKKYRLAELYLNFAEAENEANGANSASSAAVNAVRKRAGMPDLPTGLSTEQMRARIRNERRVELVWEEHRFWDVRRWKILDQTDRLVTGMEITKHEDGSFGYNRFVAERRVTWEDKYRIFPIPISDVSIIPDFTENQNPGW